MKTLEITNIKTSKTEKQLKDEITAINAKRLSQLAMSDWTQLSDVPLSNRKEFTHWRQELRELNIRVHEDSDTLNDIISRKPQPIFSEEVTIDEKEDTVEEFSDEVLSIDLNLGSNGVETYLIVDDTIKNRLEAISTYEQVLIEEKNTQLALAQISSYPFYKLIQEELIDHSPSDNPPKFLEEYMNIRGLDPSSEEDLTIVGKNCKSYFSNVNELFFEFENKLQNIYNMSDEELENELDKYGYRYRPTN